MFGIIHGALQSFDLNTGTDEMAHFTLIRVAQNGFWYMGNCWL